MRGGTAGRLPWCNERSGRGKLEFAQRIPPDRGLCAGLSWNSVVDGDCGGRGMVLLEGRMEYEELVFSI